MKKLKLGILVVVAAAALLLFYWYLSNKEENTSENVSEASEISRLLARDIEKDYPSTPREVIKLYSRITVSFYNTELSDDELGKLVDMSLAMFDDELKELNPREKYIESLKATIAEYAAAERIISDYTVQNSQLIDKYRVDGVEYAKVRVMYSIRDIVIEEDEAGGLFAGCGKKQNKVVNYYTTYEDFLLRKDENGYWKILVWKVPEMEGMDGGDE